MMPQDYVLLDSSLTSQYQYQEIIAITSLLYDLKINVVGLFTIRFAEIYSQSILSLFCSAQYARTSALLCFW